MADMTTASSAAVDMDMGEDFCKGDGTVMLMGFQVSCPASSASLLMLTAASASSPRPLLLSRGELRSSSLPLWRLKGFLVFFLLRIQVLRYLVFRLRPNTERDFVSCRCRTACVCSCSPLQALSSAWRLRKDESGRGRRDIPFSRGVVSARPPAAVEGAVCFF